jgi:hypothetical protein
VKNAQLPYAIAWRIGTYPSGARPAGAAGGAPDPAGTGTTSFGIKVPTPAEALPRIRI